MSQPSMEDVIKQQKEQCIFCKIIKGEIPSQKLYEDDKVIAIMDINPATDGHVLLMPKEHYPIMPIIPRETFSHMFKISKYIARAQIESIPCTRTTTFIANGGIAGQQSTHFMMHIIPRDDNDNLTKLDAKGTLIENNTQLQDFLKTNLTPTLAQYGSQYPEVAKHLAAISVEPNPKEIEKRVIEEKKEEPKAKATSEQKKKISELYNENKEFRELLLNDTEKIKEKIKEDENWATLFQGINIDALSAKLKQMEERET